MCGARVLSGDVSSIVPKPPRPDEAIVKSKTKIKGKSINNNMTRAEKSYLLKVATATATKEKTPQPQSAVKDAIKNAGSVRTWISQSEIRKAFYVTALREAQQKLLFRGNKIVKPTKTGTSKKRKSSIAGWMSEASTITKDIDGS